MTDLGPHGLPCRLGNFELNRPLSLLLQHNRPRGHGLAVADIPHPQLDEVAGAEFAVYGQVEQGKLSAPTSELQTDANGSNLFPLEGGLLTDELALVPGRPGGGSAFCGFHGWLLW
jgi:hypothetical protein